MATSITHAPSNVVPSASAPKGTPARLSFAGRTHVGRRRLRNEDDFALLPELGLFIVADGLGGAAAGQVASNMFVTGMSREFSPGKHTLVTEALVGAVHAVNRQIHAVAQREAHLRGMGTTFAALLVQPECVVIAHVGDSRVYRLRAGELVQLTEDHTLASELMRVGALAPEAALVYPKRHVVTRAVGRRDVVDVAARLDSPTHGDVYLLCSDGLHGEVDDDEIAATLTGHVDVEQMADCLVDQANAHGGSDNITAVVVRWAEP